MAKKEWNAIEIQHQLKDNDIDYYFFWNESNTNPDFLKRYREITGGNIPVIPIWGRILHLKIYSLK